MTEYRLVPKITIEHNTSEVFCARYSPDGDFIAIGCGDGSIRVFNATTGHTIHILRTGSNTSMPTTNIKFRPKGDVNRTKNVFLSTNAAGLVQHWHLASGKCLHSATEVENEIYALDYNPQGTSYCTAGKDRILRVYDEETKSLTTSLQGGFTGYYDLKAPAGHSNRIFATKFVPDDSNLIISGGWDNTMQIWDIRANSVIRSIYGPHIGGDALDMKGNEILTGSWRPKNALQLWDFRQGTLVKDIPWGASTNVFSYNSESTLLYSAQFSKDSHGKFIAAGGSGHNEAKIFDHAADDAVVGTITGLKGGVFTMDFSAGMDPATGNYSVAIGGGDSTLRIVNIVRKKYEEK